MVLIDFVAGDETGVFNFCLFTSPKAIQLTLDIDEVLLEHLLRLAHRFLLLFQSIDLFH